MNDWLIFYILGVVLVFYTNADRFDVLEGGLKALGWPVLLFIEIMFVILVWMRSRE